MNVQALPYVLPLVLAAILLGALALTALPQRALPGVRWFIVFNLGLVAWSLGYAAELLAPTEATKLLASKAQYLGIAMVPVAWLAFTVEYAGVSRRWRALVAALVVIPAVTVALAWTNDLHGLIWASWTLTSGLPYTVLDVEYGPWFWVYVVFSYGCLLSATGLLARVVVVRPPLFRRQAGLLLVGSLTPWLGNVFYLTGTGPQALDLTVFGFALSGILAGWAVLRWNLLAVGPIARDTIVEGMSEPVLVVDRAWQMVDVNPAAVALLGRSADELVGWDARAVLASFGVTVEDPEEGSLFVKGPDGRSFDCRLDHLEDRRGRLRGWSLVFHDVTDRAAEAAALERARRMADETARAQRAFLTNINHELRTPLNGVMGMLQLLLTSDLDEAQRTQAETAQTSAEELLELLGRVMEFTSLEAGRIVLEEVPFHLAETMDRATADARMAAALKGLTFTVDLAEGLPVQVVGDPQRVAQVVRALAGNAVKFTEQGAVAVVLWAESVTDEEVRVRVEVRDTGVGIPADSLHAVFDGFVQADSSVTRPYDGAGLSLSIAHRLVARMGGALQVESEEGKGSRFWLTLPLGIATLTEAQSSG